MVAHACYTFDTRTDFASGEHGVVFAGTSSRRYLGYAVNSAGDVNGDGFDDFLISNSHASYDGPLFLVWGRSATNWLTAVGGAGNIILDETNTDSSKYVTIWPRTGCNHIGYEAVSGWDINADGYSDITTGSYGTNDCGFVIWGHPNPWTATITAGVAPGLTFRDSMSVSGQYPVACGDINDDGNEDIFVGTSTGVAAVVFTPNITFSESLNINVNTLDGTDGFRFTNIPATSHFGYGYFGRIGDINGDGIDDLLIGASEDNTVAVKAGRAYVIFGRNSASVWDPEFDLNTFDGTNGFVINGIPISNAHMALTSVSAGDINGDGIGDFFLSTDINIGFVIFGHNGTWATPFDITTIDGTNGFVLSGDSTTYAFGMSGGSVGDMNGDGIDDLVFGDSSAMISTGLYSGAAWVLYGHRGTWSVTVTRSSISGTTGFEIIGPSTSSYFGYSARGAGDVNGDGIPDLIIGAPVASSDIGTTYLVFGVDRLDRCRSCDISGTCSLCEAGFGTGMCTNCSQTNTWSDGSLPCQSCKVNGCNECGATTGVCTLCDFGFEPDTSASTTCTACTNKQYNNPIGQQCRDCPLGFGCLTCNMSTSQCKECPGGKVLDGTGCIDCNDRQWSEGGSATQCKACAVDETCLKCSKLSGKCMQCPAKNGLTDSGCIKCSATQFSDGMHGCEACELGNGCETCDNSDGMCTGCPGGSGLFGTGCKKCSSSEYVVDKHCQPCKMEDGCKACDVESGLCTQCPGDMVVDGFGCKALVKASNETDTTVDVAPSLVSNVLATTTAAMLVMVLLFFIINNDDDIAA